MSVILWSQDTRMRNLRGLVERNRKVKMSR